MAEISQLRRSFVDILNGYSPFREFFIKHFRTEDFCLLDGIYDKYFELARTKGARTEKEQLEYLEKSGQWTKKDENTLREQRSFLDGLYLTKKKLIIKKQVDGINKDIEKTGVKIIELSNKRADLLGIIAENYANKKLSEVFVFYSLYTDKELKVPRYTQESFEALEQGEVNILQISFNSALDHLSTFNLKKLGLSAFYQNQFLLCDNNIQLFYGKPVVALTSYQQDLFYYGRYFKHLLENGTKPPENVMSDPDKFEEWYNKVTNMKEYAQKQGGVSSSVGATREEMTEAGLNDGIPLNKLVKDGKVTQEALIKAAKS